MKPVYIHPTTHRRSEFKGAQHDFLFTPGTNPPPGEFSVDFTTVPGPLYTEECTDELGSGNWQVLSNFIGDGSTTQLIDPANIPACFYQIRIDWVE